MQEPVVVLTGAGISAESGVPTFRGKDGLWRNFRPEQLATPDAFRRDPTLVWEWYNWRRELIASCEPNAAHETLAVMEATLADFTLITQNVDGLHQAAGSENVLELHGNIWRVRCTGPVLRSRAWTQDQAHRTQRPQGNCCGRVTEDHQIPLPDIPPHCPECGGLLRPDVVWFGESLPSKVIETAWEEAARCRTMLVIGTSALVQPAASLPRVALRNGAHLVEINPAETPLSKHAHEVLREPAGKALPRWWKAHRPDIHTP